MPPNNLQKHLNLKGISQTQLSEKTGLERRQINRIVHGKADPRKSTIDKILKVINKPYEVVFGIGLIVLFIVFLSATHIETCKSIRYDNINGKIIEVPVRIVEIGKKTYIL